MRLYVLLEECPVQIQTYIFQISAPLQKISKITLKKMLTYQNQNSN